MKYYLIAGEASGDLHGANLMKELKKLDPQAEFRFFGGDLMQAEGGTLVKHYANMAFMGFLEVVANLRTILKNMAFCKQDIAAYQPDVLILIDFPGFNLKIAAFAKEQGLPVYYYISPKVWAWNQKRVLKIKRVVDHMFCILPFEVDFYKDWGMQVDYVGNPLLDAVAAFKPDTDFLSKHKLGDKRIIALLPGSRKQEINYLLPGMLAVAEQFPGYQFVIAGAPSFHPDYYEQYLKGRDIPVLFRLPEINFVDDKAGKPVAINEYIGRRPIAAFGNSDGDLEMLQWTTKGPGRRFGLIVHHTDAEREYAYDRHSAFGRLDAALDAAALNGWTVVDMKTDWKRIFKFQ